MSMLFKRIKDWATSITAFRTGDVIPVDGPSGTAKMSKDSLCNLLAGYNIGFVGLVGTNMPNVKYTSGTLTIQQSLGYVISGAEAKYISNMNYSGILGNGTYAIYFKPSDSSVEVANPSPTYFNGENKYLLLGIVRISDGDIFSLVMFGRWKLNNVEQQFEMSKYSSDVATINASIDYLYSSAENLVTATSQYRDITFALKSGQSIRYSITANSYIGFNFSVYLYRPDNTFVECPKVRKIGEEAMYVANEDFIKIRFYNNNGGDGFSAKFQVVGANQIKNEWSYKKALKPINVLILGDSYSETAGFWRNYFVNYIPQGSSIVCLAVGSASVKDKYTDKVTYPYTSRPTSSDNSGNLNTFACQVEKLKRLMAGVDLDPGESQIYNGTSPDVILIQGGHNDNPDVTIDNYFIQYERQVSDVYIKQKDGKPTELGSCYIKTPMSEVDQTTFAGAYRYLVDELMQLFPSAQIYATTPANLGYWSGSVAQKRYTTSEQIRMVLNLCAVECIDWNRVANISVVRDYPSGSGTSDDPYVWAQGNGEAWSDTSDAMHPNSMGARKLGQLTAQKIVDGFFSFNV